MWLFKKYGIKVVGFWDTLVGETDELLYITKTPSRDEREKRWGAPSGQIPSGTKRAISPRRRASSSSTRERPCSQR